MFYDYPLRPRPVVPANGGTGAAGGAIARTALIGTETTVSEVCIGFRRLFRSPGSVAAAVLSLATGIAVCVAAFSLVNVTSYGLALGGLALALAAAGLYSLLSFTVRRRTREIGIRLAIGASGRQVVWTVAASLPPVLRATRIDPIHALREL